MKLRKSYFEKCVENMFGVSPNEMKDKIIAVDFDDTLFEYDKAIYPTPGVPKNILIEILKELREVYGAKLILWTCRENEDLKIAVDECKEHDLTFDRINENYADYNYISRKIYADYYIDDKNVSLTLCPYHYNISINNDEYYKKDTVFVTKEIRDVSYISSIIVNNCYIHLNNNPNSCKRITKIDLESDKVYLIYNAIPKVYDISDCIFIIWKKNIENFFDMIPDEDKGKIKFVKEEEPYDPCERG